MTENYIISVDTGDANAANNVMSDLKNVITKFNGVITHEYSLINGYSAEIPENVATGLQNALNVWGDKTGYTVNFEKDQEVHALPTHEH